MSDKYISQSYFYFESENRYIEEKASEHLAKIVFEDVDPVFSGLYNIKGEKLFRVKEKQRIGFWS